MSEDWVKSMSTTTKGDGQCGLQVPHSTFSEQLGGQSASPISNQQGHKREHRYKIQTLTMQEVKMMLKQT